MRKNEQKARDMASADYDKLARENRPFSAVPGNTFLGNYPTKSGYVEEWWEERYLPAVKRAT